MTGQLAAQCGSGLGPGTLLSILQELSLTTGLLLCLDAADSSSYSGAGQSWLDRSGNGYDFFRGTTSGAEGSDPTFNGTAGGLSHNEYWSFDGGDLFTYDTAVEAWMQNLHRNNALFTFLVIYHTPASGGNSGIFGTVDGSLNEGIYAFTADAGGGVGTITFFAKAGGGGIALGPIVFGTIRTANWNCSIFAQNESSATGLSYRTNAGQTNDINGTYSSPSAANGQLMKIGAISADPDLPAENGARIAALAFWSNKMTNTNITNLYNRIKARRPGYNLP